MPVLTALTAIANAATPQASVATDPNPAFPMGIAIAIMAAATAIIGVSIACTMLYRRQPNAESKALMRRTGLRILIAFVLFLVLPTVLAITGMLSWVGVFAGFGVFQLNLMFTIIRMRRSNRPPAHKT